VVYVLLDQHGGYTWNLAVCCALEVVLKRSCRLVVNDCGMAQGWALVSSHKCLVSALSVASVASRWSLFGVFHHVCRYSGASIEEELRGSRRAAGMCCHGNLGNLCNRGCGGSSCTLLLSHVMRVCM
jgi:hypothetical protein